MLKKFAWGLGGLLLVLLVWMCVRAMMFKSKQIQISAVSVEVDAQAVAARLARSVQFKTISHQDPKKFDGKPFLALHAFLQKAFPKVHATLKREVVQKYSLLYTWKGSDPSLAPMLLMGHMDVVPVLPNTLKEWKYPPYSGTIAEKAIWGRGTLDDKVAVIGTLEAAEHLIQKGFKPKRTIYFAFGHDEEVGGEQGAVQIAKLLQSRGVKLSFAVDEGMAVTHDIMPGFTQPLALIGIAEKGYLTLKLIARAQGGHSSMPPKNTAAGILSQAISRLEANPMPARIEGVTGELFSFVGPEMKWGNRLAIANLWLLGGVLEKMLSKKPSTNATIRTTTAVTVLRAGVKDNVLPVTAKALVNFRILPGDTIKSVVQHVKKVIADKRVRVVRQGAGLDKEPSPISDPSSKSFDVLHRSIRQVFPKTIVTPGLVLGGTDSRHFIRLTKQIFRFLPIEVHARDLKRIHGTNERITVANYAKAVMFYVQLMKNGAL